MKTDDKIEKQRVHECCYPSRSLMHSLTHSNKSRRRRETKEKTYPWAKWTANGYDFCHQRAVRECEGSLKSVTQVSNAWIFAFIWEFQIFLRVVAFFCNVRYVFPLVLSSSPSFESIKSKNKIKNKRKDMKNNNFSLKLKFCYDTLEIYRNSDFFFSISQAPLAASVFLSRYRRARLADWLGYSFLLLFSKVLRLQFLFECFSIR